MPTETIQFIEFGGCTLTYIQGEYWVKDGAQAAHICPCSEPIHYQLPWENERECMRIPARETSDKARPCYRCPDCRNWIDAVDFIELPDEPGRCAECVDEDNQLWATMQDRKPAHVVQRTLAHLIADSQRMPSRAFERTVAILMQAISDIRSGWNDERRVA